MTIALSGIAIIIHINQWCSNFKTVNCVRGQTVKQLRLLYNQWVAAQKQLHSFRNFDVHDSTSNGHRFGTIRVCPVCCRYHVQ